MSGSLRCRACGWFSAIVIGTISTSFLYSAPNIKKDEREAAIGKPTALVVQPAAVTLAGPKAMQQLIISGKYADGTIRDLTPFATIRAENANLAGVQDGFLQPKQNGSTVLLIEVGGQLARVPVSVVNFDKADPVSFRNQVIASLNVGGCNQGACHGTPSGKNGFKLSLRGYDPAADYLQLTRDVFGRRTDKLNPADSLILLKALGRIAHEGGTRFSADSVPAETITNWLKEGLKDDPANLPTIKNIEVLPGSRVLNSPGKWQQLAVLAHYSDNSIKDVTRLTVFSSSDAAVAEVSMNGLVEFKQSGEAAILCRYLGEMQAVRLMYLEPKPGFQWPNPPETNYIDKFVFAKLKMLSIAPSDLCTDSEFIRRAYLDLCGLLPTAEETKAFLANKAPDKRAKLIDQLLERPEYADFWTLKWSDVLRSSRKTIQVKGIHAFQEWLHHHVTENTGFDAVVRELLTANGSSFTNPPANYYRIARDPTSLAETTAQLFFGIRMQCAKCHNHPFEKWTQDDYYSLAAFFFRVKQKPDPDFPNANKAQTSEIIFSERGGDMVQPRSGKTMPPRFLGGEVPNIPAGKDRRDVFAEWLTRPDNTFFAKSVVNRIWYHLLGKGVVDPVDDFRDSNPSANDELLDALAKDFVANKFDAKKLIRTIMNSRTYQLSAQTNASNKDDNRYFSHAVTKLMTAEQLLDALCDVTALPEKFAGLPLGTRAIQLPDGEVNHPFLKTFGQPARELACECERESDSNLAQALQLINGPTINEKIRNPNNRLGKLLTAKKTDAEMLNELYFTALARAPLPAEVNAALGHVNKATDKRKAWEDVLWALLNTREFLFRH
ncbi:MAG TPA: DUF1553 domain-containing protein [Gemmataceae bacterium]|nr:DUF1553 domain-containing protein [Gemmataceae bacterium]